MEQQLEIRQGGFYKSANGSVMRCIRLGEKVTTFSIAESPALLDGPTDAVNTVFVVDNGITEITENEYKRAVLAQRLHTGELLHSKNTTVEGEAPSVRPYSFFIEKTAHMDIPSVSELFKETGDYVNYDGAIRDEQDVIDALHDASSVASDTGAPVVLECHDLVSDNTYQGILLSLKKSLEKHQDQYWCHELRNAIVDLGSAVEWLNEREQRLQVPAQNQPVIDGETPAEESNVIPLRQ